MTAMTIGGAHSLGSGAWRTPQAGVSDAALTVYRLVKKVAAESLQSATGQARLGEPYQVLSELRKQCSEKNWDGEGAEAILDAAFAEAEDFLYSIPSSLPMPEVLAEPTGAVAFEWYRGRGRVFVVSVNGSRSIEFAGLFGPGNEWHGKVNFEGTLPKVVIDFIRLLLRS